MDLRSLDPTTDRPFVMSLFMAAKDYILLEHGTVPSDQIVTDFFEDRPPDVDPPVPFGLFDRDALRGAVSMMFGYPQAGDCYIGLMIFDPAARGQGLGARALEHATALACERGASRQLVAVLDANPKGRAFWQSHGFRHEQTFPPSCDGHTRHRLTRQI